MGSRKFSLIVILAIGFVACAKIVTSPEDAPVQPPKTPVADGFSYPIGKTGVATQAKDRDEWYNAQDFGENDHLGEDWNKNSGGDTDCGEPVYAAANGIITFAHDAGPGWGNVVIIEHTLPSGA